MKNVVNKEKMKKILNFNAWNNGNGEMVYKLYNFFFS